jgi:hypothetical protein
MIPAKVFVLTDQLVTSVSLVMGICAVMMNSSLVPLLRAQRLHGVDFGGARGRQPHGE